MPWGSAILCRDCTLEPLLTSDRTYWLRGALGRHGASRGLPAWVVCGSPASTRRRNRGAPNEFPIDRMRDVVLCAKGKVWEIERVAADLGPLLAGSRFVAGGDLNSSLRFDRVYRRDANPKTSSPTSTGQASRTCGCHSRLAGAADLLQGRTWSLPARPRVRRRGDPWRGPRLESSRGGEFGSRPERPRSDRGAPRPRPWGSGCSRATPGGHDRGRGMTRRFCLRRRPEGARGALRACSTEYCETVRLAARGDHGDD